MMIWASRGDDFVGGSSFDFRACATLFAMALISAELYWMLPNAAKLPGEAMMSGGVRLSLLCRWLCSLKLVPAVDVGDELLPDIAVSKLLLPDETYPAPFPPGILILSSPGVSIFNTPHGLRVLFGSVHSSLTSLLAPIPPGQDSRHFSYQILVGARSRYGARDEVYGLAVISISPV